VSPAVRAIFADPWSEDVLSSFLLCIARRLLSAPAAASYLLGCAAAVSTVAPSRIRQEQLHAMWDTCLRWGSPWCSMVVCVLHANADGQDSFKWLAVEP
jgi:hypothetical protein